MHTLFLGYSSTKFSDIIELDICTAEPQCGWHDVRFPWHAPSSCKCRNLCETAVYPRPEGNFEEGQEIWVTNLDNPVRLL